MPIIYRKALPEVDKVARTGVERAFAAQHIKQALPVYHLGLSDIAESPDIKKSVQTGWHYMLKQNDVTVAHAETVIDPNGKNLFAAISEGPIVEGTAKAITATEGQNKIKVGNFEVRLLFIPALHIISLWLADEKGKADFVVPIEPTPAFLTPNELIPLNEFLITLQREQNLTTCHN